MDDQKCDVPGTLFRGPDGSLFFIPDADLEPFRVFDEEQQRVAGLLTGEAVDAALVPDAEARTGLDAVHTTLSISTTPAGPGMPRAIVSHLLPQ
jgi:hypothetical protein